MSVYKPKGSPYWHYDFRIERRRYHGSTGQTTERAALAYEKKRRKEVASAGPQDAGAMTIDAAAGRWFDETQSGNRSADDVLRRTQVMARCIGPAVALRSITGLVVSDAIARRRGMLHRGKAPANATVNRDIIAPLRAILRRAKRAWGAKDMPEIAWDALALREAAEMVREYSQEERAAWAAACDEESALALDLLLTQGIRYGELFFAPQAIDVTGRRLTLTGRKAQAFSTLTLPLRDDQARALGRLAANAIAASREHIWSRSYWGLYHQLRQAAARAGLTGPRLIHGARHHALTQTARVAGLHVAKAQGGHASITSTARYAHAAEADLRRALESRNSPEEGAAGSVKSQERKGEA